MMLKKIALRIVLILVLLVGFNYIYTKWIYEGDIQQHSDIINLVRNIPNDADIIYLGESSNTTYRGNDIDKRSISSFIGDYYPNLNTYHITKGALHAGNYKILLKHLPKENKAKTIIVTLNLRSFNAQWIYSDLETPLQKSMVLLKDYPPLLNRFLLSFKGYDIKTSKEREKQFKSKWKRDEFSFPYDFKFKNVIEWDAWMYDVGIKDKNGDKDQALTNLACHYIKGYAFQIDTLNNPRINDFNEIVQLAKRRGWNLVFNLMAENVEKAKKLVGDDLLLLMNENAELLTNYFEKHGVKVINNLSMVEDEQYIDQHWTTEHYAEKGRKAIAKNVAVGIKPLFEKEFKDPEYKEGYQTVFYNNCERDLIWGQMHTISTEKAFSGTKSSITGAGNEFSITLEYPLKIIPDSLKQNLQIECQIFQESLEHDAKIIFSANGEDFGYYMNSFDVKSKIKNINKWQKFSCSTNIPDSIRQADAFKVFVHNKSGTKVFIDDLRISFK